MSTRVMVLDSTYRLVDFVGWKKAVTLLVAGKAMEVADEEGNIEYEKVVRTVRMEFKVPYVIRLLDYIMTGKTSTVKFSRHNVFRRDKLNCQYCGKHFAEHELTIDHVIPKSQGGKYAWGNVVTACKSCNVKKANKIPKQAGMTLLRKPYEPIRVPYIVFYYEGC